MKNIIKLSLPLLLIALMASCVTGSGKKEVQAFRLTTFSVFDGSENLIQTVTISYSDADFPETLVMTGPDGEEIGRRIFTFNETGDILEIENIGAFTAHTASRYIYDESGFLVQVLTSDTEGNVLNTTSFINNENGKPVDWTSSSGRASQDIHFTAEYDEFDRVVKTTELDPAGDPIYYSASEYDDEGNEISYTIYTPEGVIDQQLVNLYSEGVLIQRDILDENGMVLYSTVYEINDSGEPVLVSNFNQYGDRSDYSEIIYDEEGREQVVNVYDYENILREKTEKSYDEWGNNIELILSGTEGEIHSITRSVYENKPLPMTEEEFNSLIFQN